MQDMAGDDPRADGGNVDNSSVVMELMSLIEHMQAIMRLLESAIAREVSADDPDIYRDVVVLDDVTPCYLKANAALYQCKARLGSALLCLLHIEPPDHGTDLFGVRDPSPTELAYV